MPDVVLLAAGGHGRVVLDALLLAGVTVHGIVDPGLETGTEVFGVPVLGGDAWLDGRDPATMRLANGLGLGQGRAARRQFFETWAARGFQFATVRHPSAIVSMRATLAAGSQLMAGAVVQCGSRIGRNAVVNTRASIDHDCQIDDHVFVGPGAVLCGGVRVADGALVGAGAILLPNVTVGRGALVAAGTVVTRDVAEAS